MITLVEFPEAYSSANEPLLFTMSSTNSTEPNFKFVIDVYVNATLVATIRQFCEPGTNATTFDAAEIVRSYFNHLWLAHDASFVAAVTADGKIQKEFYLEVAEEYGSPLTTYAVSLTTSTFTVYNYYHQLYPVNGTVKRISQLADGDVLSNRPGIVDVSIDDFGQMFAFNPLGAAKTITVETLTSSGVVLSTQMVPTSSVLNRIGIGPANINAAYPGMIDSSTHSYRITDGAGNTYIFRLNCFPKYENRTIHFLNQFGVYDTAWFRMKSTRSAVVNKKTLGRMSYRTGATGSSVYESGASGTYIGTEQITDVRHQQRMTLTTDFLSDDEFDWLFELVASPAVYLQEGSYLLPVKITNSNYDYRRRITDNLQPLQIDIEILRPYNSQFY